MGLKRVLGAADAGWLVAGSMIGAGIFYTPGLVAGRLPGFAAPLLAWTLGALLALAGAAVYAELGGRLPHAGGDYRFLAEAFGPFWGFLTGWAAFLITFSAAAAAMSIVVVQSVGLSTAAAPLLVLLLTWANAHGARASGRAALLLTVVPLSAILVIFAFGLAAGDARPSVPTAPATDVAWPSAFAAAMLPVFFTYSGWNAAAYVAGELRDPARSLARGLLGGTAAVATLYLAVNVVLLLIVPQDVLGGSTAAGLEAARVMIGPAAERPLAVAIALAVTGSASVTLAAGARIYYAMASDRLMPGIFGTTNTRGTPVAAIWLGGVWTAVLAFFGRVGELVDWATLAILLLSALVMPALVVLRRRDPRPSPWVCPFYPWTPLIYAIAVLAVAVASAIESPGRAALGLAIVSSGIPVYFAMRRGSKQKS